ncbi:arginine--tRNA ligase [bacterium]|jgi:arginyl-tRNA synthetase|nr:arginine--tRNA ligase [bacterium]
MLIKNVLKDKLKDALAPISSLNFVWSIEIPKQKGHGDYATNVCFQLARELKKSPKLIAETLCTDLNKQFEEEFTFEPINGFININLTENFVWTLSKNVLEKSFPKSTSNTLIEFVSANPTGPLHIGHGRWAVVGSTMVNIYKYVGKNVSSEFYINDAGVQINNLLASVKAAKDGTPIPENGYHGDYIHDLAKTNENPIEYHINQHKSVLNAINTSFDTWYPESNLHKANDVPKALDYLKSNNFTFELEKALWFNTTKFGDDKDRVLVKNDGNYTYFAVDIAYHKNKLDRKFTHLINILGADHHGYVHRMKAAISALNENATIDLKIGQLVNLFRDGTPVRMSKRTGDIITLQEVTDEIGSDAVRYFLSEKSLDSSIDFDLEAAKLKNSENPVYYIQYAHARICSIFRKHGVDNYKEQPSFDSLDPTEKAVLLYCLQFNDMIWELAQNLETHRLNTYLLTLARQFHTFYEKCPILKSEESLKLKRLYILMVVQNVFKTSLNLLGISAPEVM